MKAASDPQQAADLCDRNAAGCVAAPFQREHASVDRAVLSLCGWFATGLPCEVGGVSPQVLTELAERHGLTSILARAASQSPEPVDVVSQNAWKEAYVTEAARSRVALHQLGEIAHAFDQAGLRTIALKGGAAILWLYDDIGWRRLDDLDLLITPESIQTAVAALEALGYQAAHAPGPRKSREETLLGAMRQEHLCAYELAGRLPVELHLYLMRRAARDRMVRDVRAAVVRLPFDGAPVHVPCPADFLLHTAVHYIKHLERGWAPLKGIVDILLLLRRHENDIEWPAFWRRASEWGIAAEVAKVMATIEREWDVRVPLTPAEAEPIPSEVLVHGPEVRQKHPDLALFQANMDYLARMRELPDLVSRARYLIRTVFPTPDYLRYRYGRGPGRSVLGLYLRYPFTGVERIGGALRAAFLGLWGGVRAGRNGDEAPTAIEGPKSASKPAAKDRPRSGSRPG